MNDLLAQVSSSTIHITSQLNSVSDHLQLINNTLAHKSIFESQFFSAIVGAFAALFIFFLEKIFIFFRVRNTENNDLYYSLAENHTAISPQNIYNEAKIHIFGCTITDGNGKKTIIPEKSIGERIIIQLRRRAKYWKYRDFRLQKYFKKYALALKQFDKYADKNSNDFLNHMNRCENLYKEIVQYVYKKTGEDEYTTQ